MPIVEGKHYSYSPKGKAAAKRAQAKIHKSSAKAAAKKLGY